MSPSALHAGDPAPARSSDPVFGVATGLYLAVLVSPVVLLAASVAGSADPGVLYGTFLATGVGTLALAGAVFDRRPDLAPRFGASRLTWAPGLLGLAVAVGSFASLEAGAGIAAAGFFLGLVAMAFGFLLGVLARSRYATAVLECESTVVIFEAGWPDGDRKILFAVAGLVVLASGVVFVAGVVVGTDWFVTVGQFFATIGIVLTTFAQSRTYRVTPSGLAVQNPVVTRLYPWSAFDGYSRTDDAIVVRRRWLVDRRLAVTDLDDPDGVEDAVARYLTNET